jgi:hypothetical protein
MATTVHTHPLAAPPPPWTLQGQQARQAPWSRQDAPPAQGAALYAPPQPVWVGAQGDQEREEEYKWARIFFFMSLIPCIGWVNFCRNRAGMPGSKRRRFALASCAVSTSVIVLLFVIPIIIRVAGGQTIRRA